MHLSPTGQGDQENPAQQLAISNAFNAADSQICIYAHDDLVRLASANCGTAAGQTLSYDPFGNINKSGSPSSFQPMYSAATNRMTLPAPSAVAGCLNDKTNHPKKFY